jgi:hypothetical protein
MRVSLYVLHHASEALLEPLMLINRVGQHEQ